MTMETTDDDVRRAIRDAMNRLIAGEALHSDGKRSDTWRALDYGWLIVHLMHPETRALYAIDKVFSGAKAVTWSEHPSIETQPEAPAVSAALDPPPGGGLRPRIGGSARPGRPGASRSGSRGRPMPKRPRQSAFRRRNRA